MKPHDVSCYIYGGPSDSVFLECRPISATCSRKYGGKYHRLCSSAEWNAIEHDRHVNKPSSGVG
jgi:hypothetical protein